MPPPATASGFCALHVVSASTASSGAKAVLSCQSMLKGYPEIATYTLAVDDPGAVAWSALAGEPRIAIVDEDAIYSKVDWERHYAQIEHLSPARSGWYYQQILKLARVHAIAARIDTLPKPAETGVVIWDADTYLLRPMQFLAPGTTHTYSYFTKSPHAQHEPFYAINARLSGTRAEQRQRYSNVVQFAALTMAEARELPAFVGLDLAAGGFADALAGRIVAAILEAGINNRALFSEYELIGLLKRLRYGSPERLIRMIRPNNRVPDQRQLVVMRACGIDHYTHEQWFGVPGRMSYAYLASQVAIQHFPWLEAVKDALYRRLRR